MAFPAVSPALVRMPSAFSFDTSTFDYRRPSASPDSYRRPETRLTLHEYHKFQQSPVLSASPELDDRCLRRKASSANLTIADEWTPAAGAASPDLAAFAWGPSSSPPPRATSLASHELLPPFHPPPPTTPQLRPSTASPSLSSTVTTLQSSPTHTPVCRGATACASPPADEPVRRARPISSKRKFPDFQRAKRLPRPSASTSSSTQEGNELWEVYAAVFDPAVDHVSTQAGTAFVTSRSGISKDCTAPPNQAGTNTRKDRYVRFEGIASTADNSRETSSAFRTLEEKEPTGTSSLSLSRFEFPAPPDQDNRGNTQGVLSSPKSPSSPATIHLHGTSFDLVNPHESLVLGVHQIETPAEIDCLLDDYFDQGTADAPTGMAESTPKRSFSDSHVEGTPSRRPLYEDADSARRGIMNVKEGFPMSRLQRTDTNPFRRKLPAGTAARLSPGDAEDRERKGASQSSEPFDLTLSEEGSQTAMRNEAPTQASYAESDEGLSSHLALYDYTRSEGATIGTPEVEYGRGEALGREDHTTEQTYGNTSELLQPWPNEVYAPGTAITYDEGPGRASSIYPPTVPSNDDEWVTTYTGSQNDLQNVMNRFSVDSYADTSTYGADIPLPTIPRQRPHRDPHGHDAWLAGSSPLASRAQDQAQHERDVQKARSLMNDGLVAAGLGQKMYVVPEEDREQRGENVRALNRLREENPAAVREASDIVFAEQKPRQLTYSASFDSQKTVKQWSSPKPPKKTSSNKGSPLFRSPIPLRLGSGHARGRGPALEREDSFSSERQLVKQQSAPSIGRGQQEWSQSQSSFLTQDSIYGRNPYNWTPYGENATLKALQSPGFESSSGSVAQRAALDLGSRQASNSGKPSRPAMGGQTELQELTLQPYDIATRSYGHNIPGLTVNTVGGPPGLVRSAECNGPVMSPRLRGRDEEYGSNDPRREEQRLYSIKWLYVCAIIPGGGLLYGLGGLDWVIRWWKCDRIKNMGRKQKRDALLKVFPLSTLLWAALIVAFVIIGMSAQGELSSQTIGDPKDSSPFSGAY